MNISPLKRVVAVESLPHHRVTPHFSSWSLRGTIGGRSLDPFLNLDDFLMSEPTFPPHPHAGFSAVTYIFEDSAGSFRNRDSLGNTVPIAPGAVHWTEAAAGVVHEEVPTVPGEVSHGLQMFVNLPAERHLARPRALHLDPKAVPEYTPSAGARVRVLAGEAGPVRSPLDVAPAVSVLDVHLASGATLELPVDHGRTAFVLAVGGGGLVGPDTPLAAHQAALFDDEAGRVHLAGGRSGLQALLLVGTPLGQPVMWRGPFALTSAEALDAARRRYARGEMGHLDPSF